MVFSSSSFLFAFLPVTLVLYFLPISLKNKKREIGKKNLVLLVTSLVFYAWGEPVYVLLMLISIFFNFSIGRDIFLCERENKKRMKLFLFTVAIVFNFFVMAYFKYYGFAAENINSLFGTDIQIRELPLPVGISFYTFQAVSYIADVYKGKVKAQRHLIPFACYITMFPQLIAGPIVQYSDIEKQLKERTVSSALFYDGIIVFIRGLGKKVIFANTAGKIYTDILAEGITEQSSLTAWIGIVAYTMQIYFDFGGYSDMAIGLGKMLGFEFRENFNFPYRAQSITDFWRRWHISLSSWFRDYVYIPLGGNRKGTARTIFNILTVWSLTGLWHGAAWNFIAWGAFYGILLIAEKYLLSGIISRLPSFINRTVTMAAVMIGWVFFSSESLSGATEYLSVMFNAGGAALYDSKALYLLATSGFGLTVMALSSFGFFGSLPKPKNKTVSTAAQSLFYISVFVISTAFLLSETYNPFLYFRF